MKSTSNPNPRHQHQPQQTPRLRRTVVVRGDLTQLLAPGEQPFLDERLCACGHLEADHRISGPCSRCRRCDDFELPPQDDVTAPREAVR